MYTGLDKMKGEKRENTPRHDVHRGLFFHEFRLNQSETRVPGDYCGMGSERDVLLLLFMAASMRRHIRCNKTKCIISTSSYDIKLIQNYVLLTEYSY